MSIPLPNQIKVAPKPIPAPEGPEASSKSGLPKPPRRLRPNLTHRLGDEHAEAFVKMAEAARKGAQALKKFDATRKGQSPKHIEAQAEPTRNKRRTGRRAQRP